MTTALRITAPRSASKPASLGVSAHLRFVVVAALFMIAIIAFATHARAERLVADISAPEVRIASNFTGTEIVVFGTIERDAESIARGGKNDVVVVVTGPPETVVTRRKERMLGIWVNRENRTFAGVPSFYALHASSSLDALGNETLLKRFQIGLGNLVIPHEPQRSGEKVAETEDFRAALLRLKKAAELYSERPGAVEFLSPSLFRTTVPLPANVPVGTYDVNVFLFRDSAILSQETKKLDIHKTGFEQFTFTLAHNYSLAYGVAAVVLALLTGWLAGVIFRKD